MTATRRSPGEAATTTWGLLSTARINDRILAAARASEHAAVAAVASRNRDRAQAYADANEIPRAHGSYEELLADETVDAIYVSLPNHLHLEWSQRALAAGKHVLCEKPLGRDPRAIAQAFASATRAGRLLSEGFMWRHHPQTHAVERLVREGAIGRVREVRCALGFDLAADYAVEGSRWQDDPRLRPEYDGGALMDVGVYCVNAIRLFAGEPARVSATAELGESGVDMRMQGELACADGAIGRFACSMRDARHETLEIAGELGTIRVATPFLCGAPGVELLRGDDVEQIAVPEANAYMLELENLSEAIARGSEPLLGARDAIAQAAALEALARSAADGRPVELGETGPSAEPEAPRG